MLEPHHIRIRGANRGVQNFDRTLGESYDCGSCTCCFENQKHSDEIRNCEDRRNSIDRDLSIEDGGRYDLADSNSRSDI